MLEKQIEKKLVKFCRENGIYTRKFASPSNRGVPDRIFCKDGKVLFLELKRPGNVPTALQLRETKILNDHGMNAMWSSSYAGSVTQLMLAFGLADPKSLI